MSIRWKLLVPAIVLWIALFSAFNFLLAPASLDRARDDFNTQQIQHLETYMGGLAEPLLQSNLSQIYASIDSVIKYNDAWRMLELYDIKGQRLYPLSLQEPRKNNKYITLTHTIHHLGTPLGKAVLSADPTIYLSSQAQLTRQINIFMLVLLATGTIAILFIQDIVVRKPIQRLLKAAEKLANGKFDTDLPQVSNDEIGQLTAAFQAVNTNLHSALSDLEDEAFVARESARAWHIIDQRNRAVLDNVADGIVITDASGKILSANPAVCKMLGYQEEDVLGDNVKIFMPEFHSNLHDGYLSNYIEGKQAKIIGHGARDVIGKRRDGTDIELEITLSDMSRDKDRMFIAVLRDVTERNISEKAIRAERDRVQLYLDNVEVMIISLDTNCNVILVNRKGCEILGYQEHELLGKNWFDVCDTDSQHIELRDHYRNALSGKDELLEYYEGPVVTKDGTVSTIAWHNSLLKDKDGNIQGILGSGQDITYQREAEYERQNMRMQLQQAQKMEAIGQLTGGIAHDFNNMLASIMGYTELAIAISSDNNAEKIKQYLHEVYRSGERARDLIAKMLAFSRGKEAAEPDLLQLAPTIAEMLVMIKSIIPSSIVINNYVPGNLSAVQISTVELQQVIMNLCINARDAMDGKGIIELHGRNVNIEESICTSCYEKIRGEYVEITIKDNGSGISSDVIERLFDPFFTTKEVGKGTGMGLSVVHGVMHQNNGHIIIESQQNVGSSFRLLFSTTTAKKTEVLPENHQNHIRNDTLISDATRILLVDNDSSESASIKALLDEHGYTVNMMSDAYKAYLEFKDNPEHVDIVIGAQAMPAISGAEMSGAILSVRPNIPIVLLAEDNSLKNEEELKSCGITICRKPVDADNLLLILHHIQGDHVLNTACG